MMNYEWEDERWITDDFEYEENDDWWMRIWLVNQRNIDDGKNGDRYQKELLIDDEENDDSWW